MQAGDGRDPGSRSALHEELGGLRARLTQRETAIAELESIIERQGGLLERYDAVMRDLSPGKAVRQGGDDPALVRALDRSLILLEQAVASAEARSRQVSDLETQLEKSLGMLDQALRAQEAVASRGASPRLPAASTLQLGDIPVAIEETLAKYDRMLERSLDALESAYRNNQSSKKEIDERERLLSRTLDLLQNTVEAEGAARKSGFMSRLFT